MVREDRKGSDRLIAEAIVLGILVGKIRGGKFKRLGSFALRFSWGILLAVCLRLITHIMIFLGHPTFIEHRMVLFVITYCLLFIALFFNMNYKCMWLIMIGSTMNFAAIMFNGGSMPIDVALLEKMEFTNMLNSIKVGALPNYIPLNSAGTITAYLGKRFTLSNFYPLNHIFSIGDILVALGICFLIQNMMRPSIYRRTSDVIKFDHKGKALR
ncbi:MAG: DUF5317 domain-containing protein [Clostridiaceae bacterium]|nr:DUF5317 domain-containing protein [Clostridiaceae bacterium]